MPPTLQRPVSVALLLLAGVVCASAQADPLLARTARAAQEFQENAPRLTSTETLHQTCFERPPHPWIAVGPAAADPLTPRFLVHEVVSEYSYGHLKGSPATKLLEFRELVSMDGKPVQTPPIARRALWQDVQSGEDRIRKNILAEFTKFGLVDVATDYALILLAFTPQGMRDLQLVPAGDAFVGTEPALTLTWQQNSGGALEFRGKKVAHRPLHGTIWIRKSDGMPLRISASFEHEEPRHMLRDDATVDYVLSSLGFPTPATVAHRHYVDGQALTENLYTYEPFHLFTTDTTIHYTGTPPTPR